MVKFGTVHTRLIMTEKKERAKRGRQVKKEGSGGRMKGGVCHLLRWLRLEGRNVK